jgi:hypothetical protein
MYRATDGKRRKLATLVGAEEAPQFHAEVMGALKTGMVGLKKAEKKKAKEAVAAGVAAAAAAGGGGGGGGGKK